MSTADSLPTLSDRLDSRPSCTDVSIVIPTLGRPILETCLRHIADGTVWPQRVIVVDQGRLAAVAAMIDRLQEAGLDALYIPSDQSGRSAGLNRGLELVATRFVALTDDDCFVRPDWLAKLIVLLRNEPTTIWTGRVEAAGDQHAFSTVLTEEPRRYTRPRFAIHPFVGGNVGMAMEVVRRVGAFDEHPCIASAEDSDYGYRALRLGIPIAYDPGVVLDHYHWRDAAQRAARYADYARSQGGFYGTHLRHGGLLMSLQAARALVRGPLRWLRGILRRDAELRRNGRESTLNLLPGIWAGLTRQPKTAPQFRHGMSG